MKETIKKALVGGLVFGLTALIVGITYAAVTQVTSGQTLTADMWNTMVNNYNYSTSEINTGKKWIDDKDIFRTVFDVGFMPNDTTNNIPHNIAWDNVINISGFSYKAGVVATIPFANDSLTSVVDVMIIGNDIRIRTKGDWSAYTGKVILEYTK